MVRLKPDTTGRFVAAVDIVRDAAPASTAAAPKPSPPVQSRRTASRRARLIVALLALAIVAGGATLAWRQTRPPESELMVAVLPFENLSGDPDRDYLADGLADETIASLGQIDPENLAVIGRTSVMAYKGTTKSLAAIGKELGVDYLVESSLRAERRRLRITSKLIRAKDQVQAGSSGALRLHARDESGRLDPLTRELILVGGGEVIVAEPMSRVPARHDTAAAFGLK